MGSSEAPWNAVESSVGGIIASDIIEVKPVQEEKAKLLIEVTELGIVMDVKLMHPIKVEWLIEVRVFDMFMDIKLVQSQKDLLQPK